MKKTMYLLAMFLLFAPSVFSQERYSQIRIPVSSRDDVLRLARLGLALDDAHGKRGAWIDIFVNETEIQKLNQNGVAFTTLISDWDRYYMDRQSLETRPAAEFLRASQVKNFRLGSMGGFLTIEELAADLDSMHAKYPHLITARDSIGASIEKRPIWAVKISKNPEVNESEPQALYTGLTHAREPAGMMSMIYFMWYVLENYGTDPEVTMLLDHRELYFVPIVNPDGYRFNQSSRPNGGGMWRKNRRPTGSTTFGIDLNRNYGFKWGYDDIGSSPSLNDETYRGSAPFSEPETQAIKDFAGPRHFTVALNYHTYGDWLISSWAYIEQETKDSLIFRGLWQEMTSVNRYATGASIGYPVNGGSDDWMYGDTLSKPLIFSMTCEVGTESDGFWAPKSRILPLVMENLKSNLVLAHAAGGYVAPDENAMVYRFSKDSVVMYIPFVNKGVGKVQTVDVSLSCPDLDLGTAQYKNFAWETAGPLVVLAKKKAPAGTKVNLAFNISYQGGMTLDTVSFRLGPAKVLYVDDAENSRARWKSSTNNSQVAWDTTSLRSHSGRLSFSDSPIGNYPDSYNARLTLDSSFALNGSAAELRFWGIWQTESGYDCARVQVSSDGGSTWKSVEGRYTAPGSGVPTEQPFLAPVLHGSRSGWVEEVMDLSGFIGKTIKLQFAFTSDAYVNYDGIYVDDISLLLYGEGTSAVIDKGEPQTYALYQNYPNPFNPRTTIRYDLPSRSHVTLKVYNLLGQEVATLVNGVEERGYKSVEFNASTLPSSVYFYRLTAGDLSFVRKLVLMK